MYEKRNEFFTTREIVLIALFSALGGIASTLISTIVRQAKPIIGNAGQVFAGIHVFILLLLVLLIPKLGVGTFAGLIKGTIEMFMGSPWGILAIIISLAQGVSIDCILFIFQKVQQQKISIISMCIAGAVSSATNIVFSQILFYSDVYRVSWTGPTPMALTPIFLILVLTVLALISGILLGSLFAFDIYQIIREANLWSLTDTPSRGFYLHSPKIGAIYFTILLVFLIGSIITYNFIAS